MHPLHASILPGFPAHHLGELFGRLWVLIRPLVASEEHLLWPVRGRSLSVSRLDSVLA